MTAKPAKGPSNAGPAKKAEPKAAPPQPKKNAAKPRAARVPAASRSVEKPEVVADVKPVAAEPREPVRSVHERLTHAPTVVAEAQPVPAGPSVQLVTFMLAGEEYAIPIMQVQEIIRMFNVRVTEIPNAPRFIEGVMNLRGRILPVVDLRDRFGMPAAARTRANRVMVVGVAGRTVGLVVDSVVEVLRIFEERVEALPDLAAGIGTEYVVGVTHLDDRMVIVLDLESVFSEQEKTSMAAATEPGMEGSR